MKKDKLNLLLCHIPFIWFIIWSKFKNNKIEDILKTKFICNINNMFNIHTMIY